MSSRAEGEPTLDLICSTPDCSVPVRIAQLFTCLFLAILFLQSGIDKIVDRSGNLEWLGGHFASSPLAGIVPLMVTAVTVAELLAGAVCALAVPALLLGESGDTVAVAGISLSALSLTMLFFGQRLAKDYAGAAVIVPYFVLTLLGLWLFA